MPYIAKEVSPQAPDYPYFGVHTNGQVVHFTAAGVGVSITNSENNPAGKYSSNWIELGFTPCCGSLIMEKGKV